MNDIESIICRLNNIDAGLSQEFTPHQHTLRLQEWANTVMQKGVLEGRPHVYERFRVTLRMYGVNVGRRT